MIHPLPPSHLPRHLPGKKKIRSNSFAARLTTEQRDELFDALAGGLSQPEAALKVRDWTMANHAARRNGAQPVRAIDPPDASTIGKWYRATVLERRCAAARAVDEAARLHCPPDYEEQTRRALGLARLLAILEGLRPSDIALLEKIEIARDKLALDREKLTRYAYHQRVDSLIARANLLLARSRRGEESPELQREITLVLEEIDRLKQGGGQDHAPPESP